MCRRMVFGAIVVLLASSCSTGASGGQNGKLKVVAGFYPLAEAAAKVGGTLAQVQNLTPPGVEPHDLELTPQEIADIQSADVVLYLGGGFAPAVEGAVADATGITVDLLAGLQLRPATSESGEQGSVADPHVWLDPVLYQQVVDKVEATMAEARPSDALTFGANAAAFTTDLSALDSAFRDGLTGCARRLIVTSHAAFGYLAARYGLEQQSIAGLAPDAEPSAERLAQLVDLVRREGVTTIFTEQLVPPELAQTLAQEVGVTTAVLNPLEGLTQQDVAAGRDYVGVMRANLATLERALDCPAG